MSGSGKLNQREIGREGGEGGEAGTEGNFYRNVNWMQIFDIKILFNAARISPRNLH